MLGHGGGNSKGDAGILAYLADPKAGTKELGQQAAALEKERKKHDAAVRKAGGIAKIERLTAEAEKALDEANQHRQRRSSRPPSGRPSRCAVI